MSATDTLCANVDEPDNQPDAAKSKRTNSLLAALIQNLNPRSCTCGIPSDPLLESVVPGLITMLSSEETSMKKKEAALTALYDLTDKYHDAENRVELVQRHDWLVIDTLTTLLDTDTHRHKACLILNNVSQPMENKQTLMDHKLLVPALLHLIQSNEKETHFCCLVLMNVSFDENVDLLKSPNFVDTMETLVSTYVPIAFTTKRQKSVESEALKYTLRTLVNLVGSNQKKAIRICKTTIPKHALVLLHTSPNPLERWIPNSTEDCCLRLFVQLAHHDKCLFYLNELRADRLLHTQLEGKGGIHDMRASIVKARVEEWRFVGRSVHDRPID